MFTCIITTVSHPSCTVNVFSKLGVTPGFSTHTWLQAGVKASPGSYANVSLWHSKPLAVSAFVMTLSFVILFFFRIKKWETNMYTCVHLFPHIWFVYTWTLHEEKRKQSSGLDQKREAEIIVYSICCLPLHSGLFFFPSLFVSREKMEIDELQKCPSVFDEKWQLLALP